MSSGSGDAANLGSGSEALSPEASDAIEVIQRYERQRQAQEEISQRRQSKVEQAGEKDTNAAPQQDGSGHDCSGSNKEQSITYMQSLRRKSEAEQKVQEQRRRRKSSNTQKTQQGEEMLSPSPPAKTRPEEATPIRQQVLVDPVLAQQAAKLEDCYVRNCDWSKAHWDLPAMQRLKKLSVLASHDFPADKVEALDQGCDARIPINHVKAAPVATLSRYAQGVNMDPTIVVDKRKDLSRVQAVAGMVLPSRVEFVSPQVLEMKQLLGLSSLSTENDAKFQQLLGHVAAHHEKDHNMVQLMMKSNVKYTTLSKAKLTQELGEAGEDHRGPPGGGGGVTSPMKPTLPTGPSPGGRGRKKASGVRVDYNHGFHSSDIKSYPDINPDMTRRDLIKMSVEQEEQERGADASRELVVVPPPTTTTGGDSSPMADAQPRGEGSLVLLESPELRVKALPPLPQSMHLTEDGYRTWMERHIDYRCDDENDDRMDDYLDSLITVQARWSAAEERLDSLASGSPYKTRYLERKAIEDLKKKEETTLQIEAMKDEGVVESGEELPEMPGVTAPQEVAAA